MYETKILVVDDDENIVNLIKDIAQLNEISSEAAFTVSDGIKLIDQHKYHCIVLDLNIKNVNGATIVKHINDNKNSKNSKTPIILISGYIDNSFAKKHDSKFFGIVPKPFEATYMLDLIMSATRKNNPDEIVNLSTPFKVGNIKTKVNAVLKKMKTSKALNDIFKNLKVQRDDEVYIKTHIGICINICVALTKDLHWGGEATYEKLIYAAFLKDYHLKEDTELVKIMTKEEASKHQQCQLILEHPKLMSDLCKTTTEIPEDVATIILQHHELPDGSGFPQGLENQRISALASLFIVANDLATYIMINPNWNIKFYIKRANKKYTGVNFRKILKALADTQR